jgi:multiple sugar transport system substrate-binding protein
LTRLASVIVAAVALAAVVAGCGSSGSGRTATLNWYIFPEPSGAFATAAKDCSAASNGRYNIVLNSLPSDSDGQRTQLVRRLAAKDDAIDIVGMDVNWTAEFAEAGWIKEWTGANKAAVTNGVIAGPIDTATWKGKLYGAPLNSNTQLLWYRKDLVPNPPKTWAEMIQDARNLAKQGKPHYIEVQGRQYEGLMVWFNSLVNSAGGQILSGANKVALGPPAAKAAEIMRDVANSPGADPGLSNSNEDAARLGFEKGVAAFELNYPKLAANMGWTLYPGVDTSHPVKVTIGGINLGVSAYSTHPAQAFEAIACLLSAPHQKINAIKGGLPPTLSALYDDPALAAPYPFKALIKQEIAAPAIRPKTPAYSDVSLAIQKAISPPSSLDPNSVVKTLTDQIKKALTSGALL